MNAPITITAAAQARLHSLASSQTPPPAAFWVGIKTKGCSGLSYDMRFVDAAELESLKAKPRFEQPERLELDNLLVLIDPKAMLALFGTTMDYVVADLGARFEFINPNEKGRCGCGESFHI